MATHCDYKLSRVTEGTDVVTAVVRFYQGGYQMVAPEEGAAPEPTYVREIDLGERRYTFRPGDYTARKLDNYLRDALLNISPLRNIAEHERTVAPTLRPTAENTFPRIPIG